MPERPDQPPRDTLRDWEPIQRNGPEVTERLKIVNGWLYRTMTASGVAMVYVPGSDDQA